MVREEDRERLGSGWLRYCADEAERGDAKLQHEGLHGTLRRYGSCYRHRQDLRNGFPSESSHLAMNVGRMRKKMYNLRLYVVSTDGIPCWVSIMQISRDLLLRRKFTPPLNYKQQPPLV